VADSVLLIDVAGTSEPELCTLLVRCGFSIRCVDGVDAAIAILAKQVPSLAIINIGSAESGEADHALRILAGIPVVVVCAGGDADLIIRWLEAGADTVLVSPLSRRVLGARINAVLGWHSGSARRAAGGVALPAASR
jgi:DNA-binding response OmpR family regulator